MITTSGTSSASVSLSMRHRSHIRKVIFFSSDDSIFFAPILADTWISPKNKNFVNKIGRKNKEIPLLMIDNLKKRLYNDTNIFNFDC